MGGIALAQAQGYLNNVLPMIWVAIFTAISIIALVFYFLSSIQNFGK